MRKMQNKIFLIGFMASGKSTLGKKIAKHLEVNFIDTDKAIEAIEQKSIEEIFSAHGEDYFREQETKLLTSIVTDNVPQVISTGGGLACNQTNMDLMLNNGFVVFLELDLKSILNRLKVAKTKRPLLNGLSDEEIENKISSLYKERIPFYNQANLYVSALNIKSMDMIELVKKFK